MKKAYRASMIITGICVLVIVLVWTNLERKEKAKIHYTIINEETYLDIKTSIDIRLDSEVDEEILYKIANELWEDGREKYERVFICYYLPDMEVDAGAWATTHFDPKLEVKISALYK
jgi:hypothetical protein